MPVKAVFIVDVEDFHSAQESPFGPDDAEGSARPDSVESDNLWRASGVGVGIRFDMVRECREHGPAGTPDIASRPALPAALESVASGTKSHTLLAIKIG